MAAAARGAFRLTGRGARPDSGRDRTGADGGQGLEPAPKTRAISRAIP